MIRWGICAVRSPGPTGRPGRVGAPFSFPEGEKDLPFSLSLTRANVGPVAAGRAHRVAAPLAENVRASASQALSRARMVTNRQIEEVTGPGRLQIAGLGETRLHGRRRGRGSSGQRARPDRKRRRPPLPVAPVFPPGASHKGTHQTQQEAHLASASRALSRTGGGGDDTRLTGSLEYTIQNSTLRIPDPPPEGAPHDCSGSADAH